MVFDLAVLSPWGEVTHFAIVSIIGKPHLWPDHQYFLVMDDHPAVVVHILVDYGPISR